MPEKNALGLSMTVDQKFINDIAKDIVYESLTTALGGKEEIIREIIRDFLSRKVDPKDGTPSTWSSAVPYVRYLSNAMISEEVKQCVKEVFEEKRPEIRAAIKKELMKKQTMDRIYQNFAGAMIENMDKRWQTNVSVEFIRNGD